MSHNQHIMPGGKWPKGTVPHPGRMRYFDQKTAEAVNGDGGGTWSPQTPIVLTGPGILNLDNSEFMGGVRTLPRSTGLTAILPVGYSGFTAPIFNPTRSRRLWIPFNVGAHVLNPPSGPGFTNARRHFDVDPLYGCPRAIGPIGSQFQVGMPSLRVHNQASIPGAGTVVRFLVRIGRPHTSVPAVLPKVGLFRMNISGSKEDLSSTEYEDVGSGGSAADYYNDGKPFTTGFTVDQNFLLDTDTYAYYARFEDESGSGALAPSYNAVLGVQIYTDLIDRQSPE